MKFKFIIYTKTKFIIILLQLNLIKNYLTVTWLREIVKLSSSLVSKQDEQKGDRFLKILLTRLYYGSAHPCWRQPRRLSLLFCDSSRSLSPKAVTPPLSEKGPSVCPLLPSMLPRGRPSEWPPKTFTALSAHSSVEWDPSNPSVLWSTPVWSEAPYPCGVRPPTPVWKEALLSLGRQGLASFPAPSPGQASLNHGSKAGRAALSQEWYVKLGLVKKNGRESAEKSTIKSYFIITPHAKFGGGPTLPHLILKVLTAHLSFLQLFIQQTSLGWCILNLMFHIPCSLIPLYHGLHCAFPRNLAPFG